MNNEKVFLLNIIECSKVLQNRLAYINYDKALLQDDFIRDAFITPLIVIGESIKNLTKESQNYIDKEGNNVISTINQLNHIYFSMNTDILWETVTEKIPKLHLSCCGLLETQYNLNMEKERLIFLTLNENINK